MRPTLLPLDNVVQNYPWGSTTALAEFLGRPSPSPLPEAELWIGAHAKAPSLVRRGALNEPLDALIRQDKVAMLGEAVAGRYGELPFLLKVLAAAEPLSIQCHPSAEQARAGFLRENEAGIPLAHPRRNYRDPNHKPELLVALSRFVALKGFRPAEEIVTHFDVLRPKALREGLEVFRRTRSGDDLKRLFGIMLTLGEPEKSRLLGQALGAARIHPGGAWLWVSRLHEKYPGDVGVLSPLLLNLVELEPEEALFLAAGELHAYLEGTAIEIMANSDNVLRGGLTAKHVDVAALLATATFETGPAEKLAPQPRAGGERAYLTPAPEFELSLLDVPAGGHVSAERRGVELLLGIEGGATVAADGPALPLGRGRSVFVPAALPSYRIGGPGRVCRATVGRQIKS